MGLNGIGVTELIIVLAIALIVLGPKRLPEAGRSLGRGMREFKESLSNAGVTQDDQDDELKDVGAIQASKSTAQPSK